MRLLFDHNLSYKLCDRLSDLYPGATNAAREGLAMADDRTLWNHAAAHGLAIVTQDADFADMATLYGPPPKVIWLRGGNRSTAQVEAMLRRASDVVLAFGADPVATCLEVW